MRSPRKYRITIEDESHLTEVASGSFTRPVLVGIGILMLAVAIVLSGMLVVLTPLRTLLPGYLKESQRSATEEGLLRLDSLMQAYETNKAYIDNYLRVTDTERQPGDSAAVVPTGQELTSDSLMTATNEERRFMSQMEDRERFNISVLAPLAADAILFSPVTNDGIFTIESRESEVGVVVVPPDESIRCAADGSVVALYHSTAEAGHVIVVQHNGGFITAYGGVGTPLVGIGDNVYSGQVIALSPSPDKHGARKFSVRMWHNGLSIVPYQYLDPGNGKPAMGSERFETPRGRL